MVVAVAVVVVYLSTYLPIYLSIYLPTWSIYLSICLSIYLSIYISICKIENEAILRDSLNFWTWHHPKRSNSGRRPQFFKVDNIKNEAILRDFLNFPKLTTSKTKQVCETSSIFELDNIQNEAILGDILNFSKLTTSKTKQFCETSFKNGKLNAELTASYQFVLRFFHSICLKYCACHEKVVPGHTKCCTCRAKSSQQTWRFQAPQYNLSQEISARTS